MFYAWLIAAFLLGLAPTLRWGWKGMLPGLVLTSAIAVALAYAGQRPCGGPGGDAYCGPTIGVMIYIAFGLPLAVLGGGVGLVSRAIGRRLSRGPDT